MNELVHDSAHKHVSGQAIYTDDIIEPMGLLHVYFGLSEITCGTIESLDLSAVKAAAGVVSVLTAMDILGLNDISPTGLNDEPVFVEKTVEFHGQPIFAVIADSRNAARRAAKLVRICYNSRPAIINIEQACRQRRQKLVTKPLQLERGNVVKALATAQNRIKGRLHVGGQDHFYLEGHVAFAIAGEDDTMTVYSSTQHPSEVQHMVARVLGVAQNAVVINVRRMGGAFGGKETQANIFAVVAALAAKKTRRPVKIRPDRDDDMIMTGKRHDFMIDYEVGFNNNGIIQAVDGVFAARCGFSADLSGPVTDRALFHADNTYYYPHVRLCSLPLKTNTVSNTAFRGFGGPQGLLVAERIIEEIAYALGRDTLEIRRANFYQKSGDQTPYHQVVEDNIIAQIVDELEQTADYQNRRQEVLDFNAKGGVLRKGIALTPVKFGISFTATWYNQAGALLHIYKDGSIQVNHGGTEMGQGLYSKVAVAVAAVFAVDVKRILVTQTTTEKVPNTSATAASSGSDLNGMAAVNAAEKIKQRLVKFAASHFNTEPHEIIFADNNVHIGTCTLDFSKLIALAYYARVQLFATGFYKTPKIHWNRDKGKGHPFYYFAYGAAVSEVTIDSLSGEYKLDRSDILHDVGCSLHKEIDIGQIEGGFIQGVGWLTSEELFWDEQGRLRTHAPSTYKIPLASDCPRVFNVRLAEWSKNKQPTLKRSKAVGEPPLMLAVSVFEALSMAVASVADYRHCPRLRAPATPEIILFAVEHLRSNYG